MSDKEYSETDDRRSLDRRQSDHDRRIRNLESLCTVMDKTLAVMEQRVNGLSTTIDSRFLAFDRALDHILTNQKTDAQRADREDKERKVSQVEQFARLSSLEDLVKQAKGGLWVVRLLGLGAIIAFAIAIAKLLKG